MHDWTIFGKLFSSQSNINWLVKSSSYCCIIETTLSPEKTTEQKTPINLQKFQNLYKTDVLADAFSFDFLNEIFSKKLYLFHVIIVPAQIFFFVLLVTLNWHVHIIGTAFSFKVFFPSLKSFFKIVLQCQKGKETHQICQPFRCHLESHSFNKFHQV